MSAFRKAVWTRLQRVLWKCRRGGLDKVNKRSGHGIEESSIEKSEFESSQKVENGMAFVDR
jgi:hypothetical protein